ncbi:MAG: hemin ABC transporter substrate-binding protein [Rhizobiaceae bacterium]|nr:hemin ABC transporter substrate-binding protein [Rhizobiaceae bacterium]
MNSFRVLPRFGAALLLALCADTALSDERQAPFEDASRIVSIGGSVTETVFALGEQDRLVARDSTSTYPDIATKLPDVGYMRALSPEGVLSVNPTGILLLEGSGPREAIEVLKKASVPLITVPETYDHAGILEKIRIVGKALGQDDKAAELSAKVDRELTAAEQLTAGVAEKKRVLFILSLQGGKVLAAGTGTAANGIIELAGGINAVDGFSGYKPIADEAIIVARPDVVLMMDRGEDHRIADADLMAPPAIAQTPAGQGGKIIRIDGNYLLGFGPRTAGAIHDLALALYGDELKD